MTESRQAVGFSMIEMIVVICVIGILCAIAMANFIAAQEKSKLTMVKNNMHTVQMCAEAYATDTGGEFAAAGSALDPYFPTGGNHIGGAAGVRPRNPFDGTPNQSLFTETFNTSAQIHAARAAKPTMAAGSPGRIGYCQTDGGKAYAVTGVDSRNFRVEGPNQTTLILSNQ